MEKITVDAETVIRTLHEVALENPDYVYVKPDLAGLPNKNCLYSHVVQPGCIVGHVLNRLGVPLADLDELDERAFAGAYNVLPDVLDVPLGQSDVFHALSSAQAAQDNGNTWGEALRCAQSCIPAEMVSA